MIMTVDVDEILCSKPSVWWIVAGVALTMLFPIVIFQCMACFRRKASAKDLAGKVVLITGASSGLGKAFAYEFFRLGCKVILTARNETELENIRQAMMKELEETRGVKIHPPEVLRLDLADIHSLPGKAEAALAFHGQIDILINNGGISYRGNIITTDINVDMRLMLVNYFGQIALTKAILPSMMARKQGHILFVSSVQGLIGIPNRSAYVASKHALQGFCDSLRSEVAANNIKITVLSPGYMKTKLSENALTDDGTVHGVMDKTTANGFDPSKVAAIGVKAIVDQRKEIVVATVSPKLAIFIRYFLPRLFFRGMEIRAQARR